MIIIAVVKRKQKKREKMEQHDDVNANMND